MANNQPSHNSPSDLGSYALSKHGMDNKNGAFVEFRNFDTIDVEVKDSSKICNVDKLCLSRGVTIKKLQNENNKLRDELERACVNLRSSQKSFQAVTGELKKQLDVAKKRESEGIAKTVGLHLENEKLYILLESKQSLVDKLKKELVIVKRALKMSIKDICTVTRVSEYFDGGPEEIVHPQSARSAGEPPDRSPKVRFADLLENNSDNPQNNRQDV